MSNDPLLLDNQLCFPLYAAARKVISDYTPYLKPLHLTYTQYIVMMVLWEKDNETVGEIGRRVHLDNGTMTPLIKNLSRNGYVSRNRSEKDERVVVISLTEEGKKLKEKAKDVPEKMSCHFNLNREDAETLYRLLYQLIDGEAEK